MYGLTRLNNSQSTDPFSNLARDLFSFAPPSAARAVARESARFDFIETAEGYQLRGDLPGVSESDLDITVHEGVLQVQGKRAEEALSEGSQFMLRERVHGEFTRRLRLPKNADADKIEAKLEHGVLTVSIAKKQEIQARKIKIG